MLVRFTIEGGCIPVTEQARERQLDEYLNVLHQYDTGAEATARAAIRQHMDTHTHFTAAWSACAGEEGMWHGEFEPLFEALDAVSVDSQTAHDEAGKFLGLLVWNEALSHRERWHFTKYPKLDSDYFVTNYFAMDGHICAAAKIRQATTARAHGDEGRAIDLEAAAEALRSHWRRT